MKLNDYNRFCKTLPHATTVVQWGGAHVWKVGGKVFAIGGWNDDDQELFITFKCSPMSYDMLQEMPGCRPAPYLASRGMKWIQRTSQETLSDSTLKDYLRASYDLVVAGLSRRIRQELGLADPAISKLPSATTSSFTKPASTKPKPKKPATNTAKRNVKTSRKDAAHKGSKA